MARLIAVCGATGGMGGSVVRRMLEQDGWQVRAITRNVGSDNAKVLKGLGAELATASYDDVDSMVETFKGATAIFAVTQFWDHLAALGHEGASHKEEEQIMNIATAASRTSTLEHFVLHTLPLAEKVAGPGYSVPHCDSKARAAERIKHTMPDLARKTTFMWVGLYTQNMWTRPFMKPFEVPAAKGTFAWVLPISPNVAVPFAGDVTKNVGVYVNAILAHPEVSTPSKYVFVATDLINMNEALAAWSAVTGKKATFASVSLDGFSQLWGMFGREVGLQYAMHDKEPDFGKSYRQDMITMEQLGIRKEDLVGHEEVLRKNKDKLI